ncbi:MAG: HAD-IC family P-type ATPase [Nanoarchaeota archaeon]
MGGLVQDMFWHVRTVDEVIGELGSSVSGLSAAEASSRLLSAGPNRIAHEERFRVLRLIWSNVASLIVVILVSTALISLFSGHVVEFVVIAAITLLTVALGVIQEHRAGRAVAALANLTAKKVYVVRSGVEIQILAEQLVAGDIVVLKRGMVVPADIRVIESRGLSVDESALTGESVSKAKHAGRLEHQDLLVTDRDNMVFSGTAVTGGSGRGIVVATGLESELGRISVTLARIGHDASPLQRRVSVMSRRISGAVIVVCAVFFVVLLAKGYAMPAALILVGAVAVSGIPESFPLALTLALSNGVRRMARGNAIVRDLSSVETLGTTTVICTDKTGTLTENRMRVQHIFLADGKEVDVAGQGYAPLASFSSKGKKVDPSVLNPAFFRSCILCNDADLALQGGEWVLKGEPMEGALLALARAAGHDDVVVREEHKRLSEHPFDPSKKFMITVHSLPGRGKVAYLKGATERVLAKCAFVRTSRGVKKMSGVMRGVILDRLQHYSGQSLRVLAVATKNVGSKETLERGFVFEGLVAMEDPIRSDVLAAIDECRRAGIRVIMVTGDHHATAKSVGSRLGIIDENHDVVLQADELDRMSDGQLDAAMSRVAIFARMTPDHKLRIVESLQRTGEIVAMTGDGVNDAPALKKADIGIAMGKGGTDVAREASNMILTDDKFSTIVHAVKEGRTIYSNIRRFIYYLLTGNFTEVGLIVFAVLLGIPAPLTALMVLFVNLVTSTLPSFALSVEPTHHKVMLQRPRSPKEKLVSSYILMKIMVLVPVLFMGTLTLFLWELNRSGDLDRARTLAFATLIIFELFHALNARSLHTTIFSRAFFANKWMFPSLALSLALTLLAVLSDVGRRLFGTVPLGGIEWVAVVSVGFLVIGTSEMIKMLIKSEFDEQRSLRGIDIRLE